MRKVEFERVSCERYFVAATTSGAGSVGERGAKRLLAGGAFQRSLLSL